MALISRRAISAGVATAIAASALAALPARADDNRPVPTITTNGEGNVDVAPDIAILGLGVVREADTARAALDANNEAMAEVIKAMKESGVEGRDLQTSGFSIQPRYEYHRPKEGEIQRPPRIVGYTVSNNLTVRVREMSKIGEVLDKSVSLGVNSGGNIQFGNDNPKDAIDEARRKAMEDAMRRATTLTGAAGVKLGRIQNISESFNRPSPMPMVAGRMMADAAMEKAVPVEGGENTYTVNVTVTWELDQ
ncbi:MAG: SIMPL domain-containing protein [Nitratireductor sp.]|nr:SIMPL domain-containing protein [Nitratireductor sp.]MCC0022199.1 SIMPL domain-containing protein [Nitratireductor sp.]